MGYRLAIFDFDGTLADSFPWFLETVNEAAARYRFRRIEPHEVDELRGYDARRMMKHLGLPLWKLPLVARDMRKRMAADAGCISLFPGVDAMLRGLAERGVAVAVVTSNSADNVRRVLGPANLARIGQLGCGAPLLGKRAKLRQVLRGAGVSPAEALCIGDEIRDFHAAHAEGIPFGAVAWGFTRPDALRALAPRELFTRMDEIVEKVAGGSLDTPLRSA